MLLTSPSPESSPSEGRGYTSRRRVLGSCKGLLLDTEWIGLFRSSSLRSWVLRRGRMLCGHVGTCRRASRPVRDVRGFMVRQAHHERRSRLVTNRMLSTSPSPESSPTEGRGYTSFRRVLRSCKGLHLGSKLRELPSWRGRCIHINGPPDSSVECGALGALWVCRLT